MHVKQQMNSLLASGAHARFWLLDFYDEHGAREQRHQDANLTPQSKKCRCHATSPTSHSNRPQGAAGGEM